MANSIKSDNTKIENAPEIPHYCVATKNGWGTEMNGTYPADYSDRSYAGNFGEPITNFKIEASNIKKARVRNKRGMWLPYKEGYTALGNNSEIIGIEFVGVGYIVSVHLLGGQWLDPVSTSDAEGEVTIGLAVPIDAIWVEKI